MISRCNPSIGRTPVQIPPYAMNRLPDAGLVPVEEHLLVCHDCQDRLVGIDEFLAAFEDTLGRVQ